MRPSLHSSRQSTQASEAQAALRASSEKIAGKMHATMDLLNQIQISKNFQMEKDPACAFFFSLH
jgi:hypothetical protein